MARGSSRSSPDASSLDMPTPDGIEADDHELLVVEQQVARALFPRSGPGRLPSLGRFVVERRLGSGAMGVVYAARDPALDRRVAIKLVRPDAASNRRAQQRLQREALALAKLSHPNIVAIHEVGEHRGQVFLAMEHVEGQSLRAWQERRSSRAVLAMYVQAGRGLAAAHAAGLVHRDFKPDNVLVDEQGRARVVDFGLVGDDAEARRGELARWQASEELSATPVTTETRALMGTPAYMSPEQFRCEAVDASSDQFAFCVALWEASYGERPFDGRSPLELSVNVLAGRLRSPAKASRVPRWLRRACERGLSIDPRQRWPSMEALLDTLATGRTRARVRKGLAAVGVLAALGTAGTGYRGYDLAQRTAACDASGDEVETAWNDERQHALRDALVGKGGSHAATTADKVMPWLDRQAAAWRDARVEACLDADVRGQWDADTLDRSLWCLDERRMQLESLVDELTAADAEVMHKAVTAAAGLASVAPCRDERVLAVLAPPPEERREAIRAVRADVVRADNLMRAGSFDKGLALAREALARAESLQWRPLSAAARAVVGILLERTSAYADAETMLEDAYFEAADGVAPEVAFDAVTRLVFTVDHDPTRHVEALRWGRHAEVALASLRDDQGLLEASMLRAIAAVHQTTGDHDRAKELHERALALVETALGPEHPSLASSLNGLAFVYYDTGDYDQAKTLVERALVVHERALGPDHPEVAASLNNLAAICKTTGDYARALALDERALHIREQALGPDHTEVAVSLGNLAAAYGSTGDYARAKPLFERALSILEKTKGPEHPDVALGLTNLAEVYQGEHDYERSEALNVRALSIFEKTLGPDHTRAALVAARLAAGYEQTGDYERARALYERALAIREKATGSKHPTVASCLDGLGLVHDATGDRQQARSLHERALLIREEVLGPDHPYVAESLIHLADVRDAGDDGQDGARYERALSIFEAAFGPDHPEVAAPLVGLAEVALQEHRPTDAVPLAQRAVALRERGTIFAPALAEARFVLARALWDAPVDGGRDRTRAVSLAEQARDAWRDAASARADDLAHAEQWLGEHGEHARGPLVPRPHDAP